MPEYHGCEFCPKCAECLEHDVCLCCLVCDTPRCKDRSHWLITELEDEDSNG